MWLLSTCFSDCKMNWFSSPKALWKFFLNKLKYRFYRIDYSAHFFLLYRNMFQRYKRAFFNVFFGVPHLATYISLFSVNQDWVFTGINPGMAFTPLPCIIWKRRDTDPRPFDRELSLLTTTPSSHSNIQTSLIQWFLCWIRTKLKDAFIT